MRWGGAGCVRRVQSRALRVRLRSMQGTLDAGTVARRAQARLRSCRRAVCLNRRPVGAAAPCFFPMVAKPTGGIPPPLPASPAPPASWGTLEVRTLETSSLPVCVSTTLQRPESWRFSRLLARHSRGQGLWRTLRRRPAGQMARWPPRGLPSTKACAASRVLRRAQAPLAAALHPGGRPRREHRRARTHPERSSFGSASLMMWSHSACE